MDRTAIILAGDSPETFGSNKGLIQLAKKPMITHIIGRIQNFVNEIIICLKDDSQMHSYSQVIPKETRLVVDEREFPECPLRGAYTGLLNAESDYSVILPCDTPFVSGRVIDLLFDAAVGVKAAVPRWPDDNIEPLQAVYKTRDATDAARRALEGSCYSMRAMISLLKSVRYISTLVIKEIDPKMYTFMNINTPLDLRRAETLIKRNLLT
ncbi:MAG: molybdenum cofactor guanylyltransferase [Candidatus Nezhaarchaeales archaeon]